MHTTDKKPKLNDDILFLVTCCQSEPSEDDKNFIINSIQHSKFNIQHLLTLSTQHGVLPLVYKTLKGLETHYSTNAITIPPHYHSLISELKAHYQAIAQKNMLMTAELLRIMKLLKDNNIEALAFKGPTLAQLAYGDITLRQYVDLDILVHKKDIYTIDNILKDEHYERLLKLSPSQEKIWFRYAHDLGLIHPKNGVHLEMHWSFLDEDYPMQVDLKNFWEYTKKVKLHTHPISTFSNENLIVYLAIHGSKHLWERIEWIKDIDLLIRKHDIHWVQVIKEVKGTGFEKMVYLGLHLSALLFNTPLPKSIQSEIANHTQIKQVITFIFKNWEKSQSTFQSTQTMLKLFPTLKHKMLYLHKIILKPSFNEYWFINLPKGLYWVYYLVRLYLLFRKYFLKLN